MSDDDHPRIRAFSTSVAVIAAVSAYFVAPVLRFANLDLLTFFGLGLALSAGLTWSAIHFEWSDVTSWLPPTVFLASLIGLTYVITTAIGEAAANDARCASIQREMLYPKPRRADLPELFSALGCRPQGRDDVQFPAIPQPKASTAGQPPAKVAP